MGRWVSSKKRLPPHGVPVFVVYKGVAQPITYTRDAGVFVPFGGNSGARNFTEDEVSYWMLKLKDGEDE